MTSDQPEDSEAERPDLIDRLPDWLVSRDEEDQVLSKRLDRAIRWVVTVLP